ncbi:MAG: hypothetical protein E3J73_08120 [Candidatus Bathyarchaeum sp.]|nr:MAG: hypothetical protein E3J73_08120 [Candidatus Bathyarchaeum sp.]
MKRMFRRTQWDIYADMLTKSLKPVSKSSFLCGCNLSWTMLTKHLSTLVEKGHIGVKTNQYKVFQITEKGKKWLRVYKQLNNF